jgi:hypothetical protein
MPTPTCFFYVFLFIVGASPWVLIRHFWNKAKEHGWAWTSVDSRTMYVDAFKTMITASGIAVALLASSGVVSQSKAIPVVAVSAKLGAICLILCVCFSLGSIIALVRGHELAKSRYIEEQRAKGNHDSITEGKLNTTELLFILAPSGVSLSCFFVGFVFLGRIIFHL